MEAWRSDAWWFTLRGTQRQWSGFVPVVSRQDLLGVTAKLNDGEYTVQEIPCPDSRRVIQFEAMLGPSWPGACAGVELFYELESTEPLRGIRERCRTASGLLAQSILRTYLSESSYETLQGIWDRHPDSIIEFTEFSQPCGVFHQRGVVWEVRDF